MSGTKEKIIQVSVQLFNQHGLDAVRLQQIAVEAGISVGNLAYHFKNKDAIVDSVYERLFEDFSAVLRQYAASASLANYDLQLGMFHSFFEQYQFYTGSFFKAGADTGEYEQQWRDNAHKLQIQIQSRIDLLIFNQWFIREPLPGVYRQLSENVWLNMVFFIQRCRMMGVRCSKAQYKTAVWKQFQPYFSNTGLHEFNKVILPTLAY